MKKQKVIAIVLGILIVMAAGILIFQLVQRSPAGGEEDALLIDSEIKDLRAKTEPIGMVTQKDEYQVEEISIAESTPSKREKKSASSNDSSEQEVSAEKTDVDPEDDFILPISNSQKLSEEDIQDFSQEKIMLARNEIYARHGYIFTKNKTVKDYFERQVWYKGTTSDQQKVWNKMSEIEQWNVEFLQSNEL